MANRGKLAYVLRFVMSCWATLGAVIGSFVGIAHVLNNAIATVIVVQLILFSCFFGFFGSQIYKWKGERDGWWRSDRNGRDEPDEAEDAGYSWKWGAKRRKAPL